MFRQEVGSPGSTRKNYPRPPHTSCCKYQTNVVAQCWIHKTPTICFYSLMQRPIMLSSTINKTYKPNMSLDQVKWPEKQEQDWSICAVMFYFNYTCRVKKKKKSTKNIMKQRPSLLFTHSQYNFTSYLHAQILWR